jgi:uncharacterized protein involved in response to NO
MPSPFGRFDAVTIGVYRVRACAVGGWPLDRTTGGLLLACGFMHIVRWCAGPVTGLRDRLVLILHVAYAFVPAASSSPRSGARPHGAERRDPRLDGRAIGTMTLAVMSRATLGHTGRRLEASPATH